MITPDRLKEFIDLVQDVRQMQRYYRKTICPIARRKLPELEDQLDRMAGDLSAEVEAAAADLVVPVEEGGVS